MNALCFPSPACLGLEPSTALRPTPADFLFAERSLAARHGSALDLYDALHEAAGRLLTVDALYVCLIHRAPDWLNYVYHRENECDEKPEPLPWGEGPTSHVARTGNPVVLNSLADRERFDLIPFADGSTRSGSAIHWPLRIQAAPTEPIDGVLSVQAYAQGAYGAREIATVEWLALRLTAAMRGQTNAERERDALEAAALRASRDRAIADVRRFVDILEEIAALRHDPSALIVRLRRHQVELTQWAPEAEIAPDPLTGPLKDLSERELEVLACVAAGLSNAEVAEALMCSRHTVKRHLDNVYAQTPLRNRSEIARASGTIHRLRMAHTDHAKST